ncbi:MAG: Rpn family recombination-promoting nuclease/putative transposase [Spirochaetaceae bacterium]|nr:Rpn family recombination-promoting nuclease/putative transposase [Spirochaetaceae bacterium]
MEKFIKPKPFEKLTCSDNFMFAKVMEDPDLCKSVLEILLDIKIGSLSYPEPEKTIQTAPDARGIRLDVHTHDGKHDFDIEMQTTLYKELRKRSRYYQSLMDVDYLLKGHPYSKLKENIVIFICLDDLFKKGLPVYTFENTCRENNSVKLEDRTLKVFYNCSSWKDAGSKARSDFLKFLLTDNAESDLCQKLKEREKKIKMTARAQKEYMDYCMITQGYYNTGKEDGYKQGVEDGEARGEERAKLEAARNMLLKNLGTIEQIAEITGLSLEKVRELAKELEIEV